jgi:hypothetical protein
VIKITTIGNHKKYSVNKTSKAKPSRVREGGNRVHKKGARTVSRR